MKLKYIFLFQLLSFVLLMLLGKANTVLACYDGNCPGGAQINWIISMQDSITGLVDSYQNDEWPNAYIFDQALAIIALTDANKIPEARSILNRLRDYQRDDPNGAWYVAYRVGVIDANWPPGDCMYYRTGDIAWMVMAINFYEAKTRDPNYAIVARRALGWMDTMMHIDDQNDGRYGSLRYSSIKPNIISTEHNIDAYSAYYWRGMLDANDSYLYKASLISNYLRREMWAPTPGSNCCRDVNVFCEGYNDCNVATDCLCWGILSLGPIGPDGEPFYKSLYWLLDSNLQTTCDFNNMIIDINGFKSETDELCDYVRVDLTDSVAAALFIIGDDANGISFHDEMRKIVDAEGGLVHSFNLSKPWCEIRHNYVASAAWYYFNEVRLNPFNLRPCFAECRAANIDGIGKVDFIDYAILALDWLETGLDLEGDINGDSRVHNVDLDILTEYWLSDCNE
jgi:hypothetical protein